MLHFIYNPIAGKGEAVRARAAIQPLLEARGVPHRFYATEGPGGARALARRITGGVGETDVVAMGGDGTLNEVLNGLDDPARVRLGLIPCGSGNDFASAIGLPPSPEAALEIILDGEARLTDYMECSGVRGINAIGTGIDVDILRRYGRMKLLKGSAAYLASLVLTLFTFRAKAFRERAEDGDLEHRAMIACCGNGQRIGGGIPICPEAVIDDGLMDIVIVDDVPRHSIPGSFVKLMKRKILELPTTAFRRDKRLVVESDAPMPIQIDGEIYEDLPFDVKVVSGALKVYRP